MVEITSKIHYDPKEIEAFCTRWKVRELCLFGSVLRDDFRPDSDVDVLISIPPESSPSWSEWIEMEDELRGIFNNKVDLVSKSAVEKSENPYRKRHILSHLERLYVA